MKKSERELNKSDRVCLELSFLCLRTTHLSQKNKQKAEISLYSWIVGYFREFVWFPRRHRHEENFYDVDDDGTTTTAAAAAAVYANDDDDDDENWN